MSSQPGFLTLKEIVEIQRNHELLSVEDESILNSLEEKLAGGNTVAIDLRLGSEVFLSCDELPRKLDKYNDFISIKPGEFALLMTYEKLDMPNDILAFISMKFKYKQKGLINVSGFHIDPAYKGYIVYSVYNAGPLAIPLKFKDEVFTVIFARLGTKSDERTNSTFNNISGLRSDMISSVSSGEPLSLRGLEDRVHKIEHRLRAAGYSIPIGVAVITAALAIIQYLTK